MIPAGRMKTRILWVLALLSACVDSGSESRILLGDQWNVELKRHYVVGTDVDLRLTERFLESDGTWSLFPLAPCTDDRCVPIDRFQVTSSNPDVLVVEATPAGPVARALAAGEVELVARVDDEVVVRADVVVARPGRVEIWPEGFDELTSGVMPYGERVRRMAGGVLDLNVRYYVGEERFFGADLATFTSDLPLEIPTWAPAGNIARISGDEVGVETVRVDALGFSRTLEVETVDATDALELLALPAGFSESVGWGTVLAYASVDGEELFGSLPVQWEVDGVDAGVGAILGCRAEAGASVVVARVGGVEATVTLTERCAATRLEPWSSEESAE